MENINAFETIGVCIATLVTYLCSQKWIFPLIAKGWHWLRDREQKQIDVTEELHTIKMNETEYYSQTFDTLLNQIQNLEEELNKYASELERLRTTILRLNSKLYKKSMLIADLQRQCCMRENCPMRLACANYCDEIIENGDGESVE